MGPSSLYGYMLYGATQLGVMGLLSFKRVAGSPKTLAQEAIKRGGKSYRTGGSPIPLIGHVSQKSIFNELKNPKIYDS